MAKFDWIRRRKKTDPELPLEPPVWLRDHSNGEYFHKQTPKEAKMREIVLRTADERAGKLGLERREFLASSMGMATTMAAINFVNGCSESSGPDDAPSGDMGGDPMEQGTGPDQPYVAPMEALCEESDFLSGNEFILDAQTHSFDDGEWRDRNPVYPIFLEFTQNCDDRTDPLDCMDRDRYGELMFVDSDTTVAVISSWPAATCNEDRELFGRDAKACGLPLSNAGMRDLRDWMNGQAMSQRVVNQVQIMPNDNLPRQLDIMTAAMEDPAWKTVSWKCYPAWKSDTYQNEQGHSQGYFLTDPIGRRFIEHGLDLGVPNFAVHKGLPIPGFDVEHNKPTDVGPVAKDYPTANFIIYHSAINAGTGGDALSAISGGNTEGVPYDPDDPNPTGANMLIRSLQDSGLEPGSNVYAELGSAWSNVMTDTNAAQHLIGKLLKYVGEDNVIWGTDAILSGSPQRQIELFRSFQITPEFQDMYGYAELTDAIKAKIFGLNGARIYRVDAEAARCAVDGSQFAMRKQQLDEEWGPRRWTAKAPLGPRSRREFLAMARENVAKGHPG